MEFKSKISNTRIGGYSSEEQVNEIRNIMNFYDFQEDVIKPFKDYYKIINNAVYDKKTCQKDSKY